MIRFDAVTKEFPDGTVAVDELTLTAPTGKITVLVGPSGCGKTTSLRMVNRMIEPTRGSISLDGQDTGRLDQAELRRGIGYVIQHAGLFPHRTVLDNIGTVPRLLGWDRKKIRARSSELLERVGLETHLGERYPSQLSGGQQQRVGVARALAADPPVMLMDEPFAAVDPIVREQLQDEFLRLQDELGKTIVFVTHDIDEAIKLGDQVAVLRVGGTLAQVADAGLPPGRIRPTTSSPTSSVATGGTGRCSSRRPRGCRCARSAASCSASGPTAGGRPGSSSSTTTGSRSAGWSRPGSATGPSRMPTCTGVGPWPAPTARCVGRSTPHCRPRPGGAWSSTRAAPSSAPSWRTRCSAPSRTPTGPNATRATRCEAGP